MSASLLLSWREGVSIAVDGDGALRVQGPHGRIVLRKLAPFVVSALHQLAAPGAEEERLTEDILVAGGAAALMRWYYTLQGLARRGLVCRSVHAEGRRLAALLPASPAFVLKPPSSLGDGPHLLSRFAYLRREDETMVLESPLAHARLLLDDGALAVVGALAKQATMPELTARANGLPAEAVACLLVLLADANMLQEESSSLRSWEFHDLLFHARSRKGRCEAPFGATYRMAGITDPPPAVKPVAAIETYELYRPDLEQLRRDDPPLAEVMEKRCSVREYEDHPLTARQLGEFLYRVGRVKDARTVELATPSGSVPMEFVSRPYPSGGALYELEFYLAVQSCDGLAPGLYHYEAQHHRLARLRERTAEVDRLLSDAAASASLADERIQVLVILAARFARLAWKYSSIAYALILKHVGVVYQTMYLTAAAMDLAPCALGGGDADLFARAAGTDYYAETSVGEFLLGSRLRKPAASAEDK